MRLLILWSVTVACCFLTHPVAASDLAKAPLSPVVQLLLRSIIPGNGYDPVAIRRAVAEGGDINESVGGGYTVLMFAVLHDDLPTVCWAISHGANVNASVGHGRPHLCAVSARESPITVLHLAAGRQSPAIVRALLEAGADPSAATWAGDTPLKYAERRGRKENARLLRAALRRPK
jgi:ankyrin repeat protein